MTLDPGRRSRRPLSLQLPYDKLGHMQLRIERGVPSDEELAALVGVLLSRPARASVEPTPTSRWAAAARPGIRLGDGRPSRLGPQSWRASTQPR